LRSLRVVVVEEIHFGLAAERLFLSRPAPSRQIRALERLLGVDLLRCNKDTAEVTAEGRALLPEVHAVLAALTNLEQTADVLARQVDGHLVVGTVGAEAAP
jgi:DNA-binding transcriptional LysR family regulator